MSTPALPLIAEVIGTFIFLSAILWTSEAIPIAIALAAVIFVFGTVSGGHFNPAVSVMFFAKGNDPHVNSPINLLGYIIAQLLGAMLAISWLKQCRRV